MAAPKTANINVTVGSTEYVVSHSNFSELKVTRTAKDVNDSFELKILDNDAYEIEGALLSGNNYMQIDYIDDNLKIYKTLGGFVYKMESSFIDNRNMLSLKGLVSSSIKDKYEKYSFSWNVVPKFDWGEVLGDANWDVHDANYDVDSGLDQFFQGLGNFFKGSFTGWKAVFTWNWNALSDYKEVIDAIFSNNLISTDKEGNYYVQKYKRETDYAADESDKMTGKKTDSEEDEDICKSDGNYVVPIRPHKLLKLICCGGKFSDLLEKEYTDYKGTAFYKSDYSEAEWYFIKKWFEKMGSFKGLGYGTFNCSYNTKWDENEYIQTKQSYLEFMYNFVLPKCVQEKDNKKYTNFYLSFEEGSGNNKGSVTLARLDASVKPTNVPKYTYYGKFDDDGENKGRMTSFSPVLDIMTSMITKGTYTDEEISGNADISKVNLVGSKGKAELMVSASKKTSSNEGRYNVKWGVIKVSPATVYSSNKSIAEADIIKTFNDASELAYKATATIAGFNKLAPQEYIEIILLPKNDTGMPTHHHMSGTYFILQVTDTIANGKFSTSLELIKNINNIGNTAVVEDTENLATGDLKYTVKTEYTTISSSDTILEMQMKSATGRNLML